jgi:hypothetical protein
MNVWGLQVFELMIGILRLTIGIDSDKYNKYGRYDQYDRSDWDDRSDWGDRSIGWIMTIDRIGTIGRIGPIGQIGQKGRKRWIGWRGRDRSDMTRWRRTEFWHHRTRWSRFEGFWTTGRSGDCRYLM